MKFPSLLAARNMPEHTYGNRPALIVCLGDSVTHGCFTCYKPEAGYAAILQRRLRFLYPAAAPTVLNAGIGGDNSGGGLKRLERDVLSFTPDLVTVNFGLNDSVKYEDAEEGLAVYTANMRAIFERILSSGAEAMLVTPNLMCDYVSHAVELPEYAHLKNSAIRCCAVQNAGVLTRFVDAAREVARSLDVPIADAHARWCEWKANGVDTTALLSKFVNHPNEEAHNLFADEILRTIFA